MFDAAVAGWKSLALPYFDKLRCSSAASVRRFGIRRSQQRDKAQIGRKS
jgi:hypothetical protein